jgi:hypothetical protein
MYTTIWQNRCLVNHSCKRIGQPPASAARFVTKFSQSPDRSRCWASMFDCFHVPLVTQANGTDGLAIPNIWSAEELPDDAALKTVTSLTLPAAAVSLRTNIRSVFAAHGDDSFSASLRSG